MRVTDFPLEVPIPPGLSISREEHEEVREWILAVSMDQRIEQGLPLDPRGIYVGSLKSHNDETNPLVECVLTGYPIIGATVPFEIGLKVAAREDWNRFVSAARQATGDSPLNDVLAFIQQWCGNVPNYTF